MITYKATPDFVMRNIAGDNLLVKVRNHDFGNTNVYVLNDTGAFLWENLSEKKSRTQLVAILTEKYGIEQTQAEKDVDTFLDKCVAEGFVSSKREGM